MMRTQAKMARAFYEAFVFAGFVWVSQDFLTLAQLTHFLNQLPVERQAEAKIVAAPARFLGYVLLYRVEKP